MTNERDARDRLSLLGHGAMPMCNPLSLEELDSLLDEARLEEGARVLDLGAGRGDAGLRCAHRHRARPTLVDHSSVFLAEAAIRADGVAGVELVHDDGARYLERASEGFALAICLGATHALGGMFRTARAISAILTQGSAMLIGDLVALGPQAAAAFEIPEFPSARYGGGVFVPPARVRAYEEAWSRAVLAHLDAHPANPAAPWARARIAWMRDHDAALDELAFLAVLLRR